MRPQIPKTTSERKELHDRLYQFAVSAVRDGTTKGLKRFVEQFDAQFQEQLLSWLEKYTPVRKRFRGSEGEWHFMSPAALRTNYDLAGARLNPYYSMEPAWQAPKPQVTVLTTPKHSDYQLSDRQLATKALKLALNEFIDEGTREAKAKLLCKINEFPSKNESARGSPFWQGGRADGNRHG